MQRLRLFSWLALLSLGACNAILGNEEGVLLPGAKNGGQGGATAGGAGAAGRSNGGRGGEDEGGHGGENAEGGAGGSAGAAGNGNGGTAGSSAGRRGSAGTASAGDAGEGAAPNAGSAGRGGSAGAAGSSGGGCDPTCDDPRPYCVMGDCVACTADMPPTCGANNTPQTCVDGVWDPGTACSGNTPVCSNGVCVGRYLFGGIGTVQAVPGAGMRQLVEHGFRGGKFMNCTTNRCVAGGLRP